MVVNEGKEDYPVKKALVDCQAKVLQITPSTIFETAALNLGFGVSRTQVIF